MKERDGRDYLLSQALPENAEEFEERLMEDDEAYETLLGIEDDLFDDYARGRLTGAEKQAFEGRFGHQTDRIAFARALAQRVPRQQVYWGSRRTGWLAAAATLVLATGIVWFVRERTPPLPVPPARPVTSAPPMKIPSVLAVVTLGTSRAAAEAPAFTLPKGRSELHLRVRLNAADRFETYAMELRSANDRVVWQAADLKAAVERGDLVVVGTVPSEALSAGVYELAVRGGGSDLGFVTIKINRMP